MVRDWRREGRGSNRGRRGDELVRGLVTRVGRALAGVEDLM